MKTIYKICLLNGALALVVAAPITFAASNSGMMDYIGFLGLTCLVGSVLNIPVGLLLLLIKRTVWGQGCLLSAGILLLLGFALCSTLR